MEALDARNLDVVEAEKAGDVQRGGLVGLADLGCPLFLLLEGADADHLPLLVVVEVGAGLSTKPQNQRHRRWKTDQSRLHDCRRGGKTLELLLRFPLLERHVSDSSPNTPRGFP